MNGIKNLVRRALASCLSVLSTEQIYRLVLLALGSRGGLVTLLGQVETKKLAAVLKKAAVQRTDALPPADALRFLLALDSELYVVQGRLAVAYDNGVHTKHRHTGYHEFFIQRVTASERVLDIGCGMGALAYDVADKTGAKIVGIDLSHRNIEMACQRFAHAQVKYVHGDALKALPGEHFDTVILSNVLEHLPGRPAFLRRVQAAVSPRRFLIRVPVFERDWRVPLKQELGVEWRLDPTHETEYTLESFAEEMTAAGLRVVNQQVRWGEIWAELIVP